jgi:hypothetical protein
MLVVMAVLAVKARENYVSYWLLQNQWADLITNFLYL